MGRFDFGDDDSAVLRLATIKKKTKKTATPTSKSVAAAATKQNRSEQRAPAKKRRNRSDSVHSHDAPAAIDDPRERLAAFHQRMFDAKHDDKLSLATPVSAEDAIVLAKWKPSKDSKSGKKRKTSRTGNNNDDDDDDDAVPRIAFTSSKRATRSNISTKQTSNSDDVGKSIALAAPVVSAATAKPIVTAATQRTVRPLRAPTQVLVQTSTQTIRKAVSRTKTPAAAAAGDIALAPPARPAGVETATIADDELLLTEDPLEKALRAAQAMQARVTKRSDAKDTVQALVKQQAKALKQEKHAQSSAPVDVVAAGSVVAEPAAPQTTALLPALAPASTPTSTPTAVDATASAPAQTANATEKRKVLGKKKKRKKLLKQRAMSIDSAPDAAASLLSQRIDASVPVAAAATVSATVTPSPTVERALASEPVAAAVPPSATKSSVEDDDDDMASLAQRMRSRTRQSESVTGTTTLTTMPAAPVVENASAALMGDSSPLQTSTTATPRHKRVRTEVDSVQQAIESAAPVAVAAAVSVQATPFKPSAKLLSKRLRVQTPEPVLPSTSNKSVVAGTKATASERATKPPTKRQRAEKVLQQRQAVAQAHAAANAATLPLDNSEESGSESDRDDNNVNDDVEFVDLATYSDASDDMDDDNDDNSSKSVEQTFSKLIDEAARQQWELLEVGRLVKLFAGTWRHKKKPTARFLRRNCPELVNVEFLEGLDVALKPNQLIAIFARGSGTSGVFINKLASAIENGNLTVHDAAFVDAVATRAQCMATNSEVLALLLPLLESLSTVRDVSTLLQSVCADWHVDRAAALVQQVLLSSVFHDLDGNQDELLEDLPRLRGKLDFPSRLDQEDADENGNLIGLIASDGSDSDASEHDDDDDDDDAEDALSEINTDDEQNASSDDDDSKRPYEGETDSEEERAARGLQRPKRRSRFILDEADEDSGDGEQSDESEHYSDDDDNEDAGRSTMAKRADVVSDESSSSSESDSEDESWRSKPKTAVGETVPSKPKAIASVTAAATAKRTTKRKPLSTPRKP